MNMMEGPFKQALGKMISTVGPHKLRSSFLPSAALGSSGCDCNSPFQGGSAQSEIGRGRSLGVQRLIYGELIEMWAYCTNASDYMYGNITCRNTELMLAGSVLFTTLRTTTISLQGGTSVVISLRHPACCLSTMTNIVHNEQAYLDTRNNISSVLLWI